MNNEPNTEPITEITEAPMETKEALIDTNETDIEPISFSIEDQPKDCPASSEGQASASKTGEGQTTET